MGKTLLILGNGFDLAHGLPTKYSDFLEFAKRAITIYTFSNCNGSSDALSNYIKEHIDPWGKSDVNSNPARENLKDRLKGLFRSRNYKEIPIAGSIQHDITVNVNAKLDKFFVFLKNNIWYEYILRLYTDGQRMRGENWIDFESEISHIIQVIDEHHKNLNQTYVELATQLKNSSKNYDLTDNKIIDFLKICDRSLGLNATKTNTSITVGKLRAKLYDDLEDLINAFEIYITEFVENVPCNCNIRAVAKLKPDYVISFNYTKTYEEKYNSATNICHIHGICDNNPNNMVLGIDEYVDKEKQGEKVDFAIFKKFIQRIRKRNDVSYVAWAEELEKAGRSKKTIVDNIDGAEFIGIDKTEPSDVYIFGHSLDVTDKDILRPFFMSPVTKLHIFARDKASEGDLITNLLRIMDEDVVIAKSTSNPAMIEFLDSNA